MPHHPRSTRHSAWRLLGLAALVPLLGLLQGCITTALIIASQIDLPPACSSLSSVDQALTPRCGGYKNGMLVTKDVNTPIRSDCPLTKFASQRELWNGLPELIAKGAKPEHCNQSPLAAMAAVDACPDFAALPVPTIAAVRWLAVGDAQSVSAPVLHMLSCPSAKQAGLTDVITTWVAQQSLAPAHARFSPLSAVHPSSLREPWVALLLASGHKVATAAEQDPSAYERALRSGDLPSLQWWTQHAPQLVHRVPAKDFGYVPWLPLARVMTPGFAASDDARQRSVDFLLAGGASASAVLPHDRSETVLSYTRRVQPQMAAQLENALSGKLAAARVFQGVTVANLD
jgi:hypothetical protein